MLFGMQQPVLDAIETGRQNGRKLLIAAAIQFDRWAHSGNRETYSSRRAIAYHLRKALRKTE